MAVADRRARPDISVVICTRDRPELLQRAIAGVASQSHEGVIETLVVFDRSDPDASLDVSGWHPTRA